MTIAEVYKAADGTLAAKIVEALDPKAAVCNDCSGKNKGKSTIGMPIVWDHEAADGGWSNGQGYQPSADTRSKAKLVELADGGHKHGVRGRKYVFRTTATGVRSG